MSGRLAQMVCGPLVRFVAHNRGHRCGNRLGRGFGGALPCQPPVIRPIETRAPSLRFVLSFSRAQALAPLPTARRSPPASQATAPRQSLRSISRPGIRTAGSAWAPSPSLPGSIPSRGGRSSRPRTTPRAPRESSGLRAQRALSPCRRPSPPADSGADPVTPRQRFQRAVNSLVCVRLPE